MRVLICGVDGYLGWSLANHLARRGHDVGGADLFLRRRWVAEMASDSVTPIGAMSERRLAFAERYQRPLTFFEGDFCEYGFVERILREFQPDAVVHLAEVPSAPYSMIDVHHAVLTQTNNVVGTLNVLFAMRAVCPTAHLVKLGTMGEYGTPNVPIPEGFFDVEYRGHRDTLPFPRQAGSWYHWSKVHDSNNVMFAARLWGLRATDIMQGVVFGTRLDDSEDDDRLLTRFDIDQSFGTVLNRFCAQAVIGLPLTPFGSGGQQRGFIPLRESMECLTLALGHPAQPGEYRVFNQFADVHTVADLASRVQRVAREFDLSVDVRPVENPRAEKEQHFYRPDHEHLFNLGYRPKLDFDGDLRIMFRDLIRFRDRITRLRDVLMPDIRWQGARRRSEYLEEASAGLRPEK